MKPKRKMERVHTRKLDRGVARGLLEKTHALHRAIKFGQFSLNWREIQQEVK